FPVGGRMFSFHGLMVRAFAENPFESICPYASGAIRTVVHVIGADVRHRVAQTFLSAGYGTFLFRERNWGLESRLESPQNPQTGMSTGMSALQGGCPTVLIARVGIRPC